MLNLLRNLWRDEEGQDLIEYALLLAFLCLFAAAVFITVGQNVSSIWSRASIRTSQALSAANTN